MCWSVWKSAAEVHCVTLWTRARTAELSQCLLFFAFLCERWGDRDLDLPALWSGDGDRERWERLDRLGDLINRTYNILTLKITLGMNATAKASQFTYFKGEMLLDFRAWCPGSLLRLLSPSSFFLLLSLLLLSSLDLSLDFDVDLSFFSSSFSNSFRTE